jgi:hypothetical protein
MKRIVRLTESDLTRIIKRVIMEQPFNNTGPINYTEQIEEVFQECNQGDTIVVFENFLKECKSCVGLYTKMFDRSNDIGASAEDTLNKNLDLSDSCLDELTNLFGEDYDDITHAGEFFICMNKKFSKIL